MTERTPDASAILMARIDAIMKQLEPEAADLRRDPTTTATISIAISLKRIADQLEQWPKARGLGL